MQSQRKLHDSSVWCVLANLTEMWSCACSWARSNLCFWEINQHIALQLMALEQQCEHEQHTGSCDWGHWGLNSIQQVPQTPRPSNQLLLVSLHFSFLPHTDSSKSNRNTTTLLSMLPFSKYSSLLWRICNGLCHLSWQLQFSKSWHLCIKAGECSSVTA